MKILVVEDTPAEQKAARTAVREAGHVYIVATSVHEAVAELACGGYDGVITDLHFPPYPVYDEDEVGCDYAKNPPPSGLCVVIACLGMRLPVVVCTTCDGGHHGKAVSWIYDALVATSFREIVVANADREGLSQDDPLRCAERFNGPYVSPMDSPLSPFGWVENKDWTVAVAKLAARVEGRVYAHR
jgi:CheY-like chemotaxis protein